MRSTQLAGDPCPTVRPIPSITLANYLPRKDEAMAQVKPGDKVRVHYIGSLEDGTIFSSTYEENEPFEFTVGGENVLAGFGNAVVGMKEGDTKSISMPPEDAYGPHKKEFVYEVKKAEMPPNMKLELGKRLQVRLRSGEMVVVTIISVSDQNVILDANDPLAGKTLNFEIELLEIL